MTSSVRLLSHAPSAVGTWQRFTLHRDRLPYSYRTIDGLSYLSVTHYHQNAWAVTRC